MISISIPWAAFGFWLFLGWIQERWRFVGSPKKFTALLFVILLVALFIQGRVIHPRDHRLIQKEAGLWMKDHLPRGGKIMSRMPQEAFYAELPWVILPNKSYEEIFRVARSNGIRYFILDEDVEKHSPGFFEKLKKDLILIKEWNKQDQKIAIFEIVYP
jgi:hypothetical protein